MHVMKNLCVLIQAVVAMASLTEKYCIRVIKHLTL